MNLTRKEQIMPFKNNTTSDSYQRLTSFLEAFNKAINESIPNNKPITDLLDSPQPLLNSIAIMPNNDVKKNTIEMGLRSMSSVDHLSNESQQTFDILSKIKTSSEKQLTFVLSKQSSMEAFAELKIVVESKVVWDIAAKKISQKGKVSIPITNPNILDDPSLLNLEEINGQYTSEIIAASVKEIYQDQALVNELYSASTTNDLPLIKKTQPIHDFDYFSQPTYATLIQIVKILKVIGYFNK